MRTQAGNVLFLILIAVALFAALSYAVTQSTRSGGGNASSEKISVSVSRMMQYAALLDNTVLRLTLSNGCTATQLSFEPPPFSGSGPYYNAASPANFSCHVFHPAGGNVAYEASMPADLLDPTYVTVYQYGNYNIAGMFDVQNVGTSCLAASCADLVLYVHGFNLDACTEINRKIGVTFSVPTDLNEQLSGYEPQGTDFFNGTFQVPTSNSGVDQNTRFFGSRDACIRRHDLPAYNNPYGYYHVILPR